MMNEWMREWVNEWTNEWTVQSSVESLSHLLLSHTSEAMPGAIRRCCPVASCCLLLVASTLCPVADCRLKIAPDSRNHIRLLSSSNFLRCCCCCCWCWCIVCTSLWPIAVNRKLSINYWNCLIIHIEYNRFHLRFILLQQQQQQQEQQQGSETQHRRTGHRSFNCLCVCSSSVCPSVCLYVCLPFFVLCHS